MVTIAASTKLWAFTIAEQMERHGLLDELLTSYSYTKNTIARRFIRRIDKEKIPSQKIQTNLWLAFPIGIYRKKSYLWNDLFDHWVAGKLKKSESRIFIGWSGMSLHSIRAAKKRGMITILERGSSHILTQNQLLQEEYGHFDRHFSIQSSVIQREVKEYEEADYISIPSDFVKKSFLDRGFETGKLLVNPFGANQYFSPKKRETYTTEEKFRIVYLGTISIRKGLVYLFQALQRISIKPDLFEVWFIGTIEKEMRGIIDDYKKDNWTFFGHVNYYELRDHLAKCDVGVQPSMEEGLSMVIPQMMYCGIPVIVTPNTGAENLLKDTVSGFVVPVRDPEAIAEKINLLYRDRELLKKMKANAVSAIAEGFTWDDYGDRYTENILSLLHTTNEG